MERQAAFATLVEEEDGTYTLETTDNNGMPHVHRRNVNPLECQGNTITSRDLFEGKLTQAYEIPLYRRKR